MSTRKARQLVLNLQRVTEVIEREIASLKSAAEDIKTRDKAVATLVAYRSDMKDYARWAGELGLEAIPASPDQVVLYLTSLQIRGLKYGTIVRRRSAISYVHERAKYPVPNSPDLKRFMSGLANMMGTRPEGKDSFAVDEVLSLLKSCPDTLKGSRDRALIAVAMGGALRRSEVVGIDAEHIYWRRNNCVITIPRSKEDQKGKGQDVIIEDGKHIKSFSLLRDWIKAGKIKTGPVFRGFIGRSSRMFDKGMGDDAFVRMIKDRCVAVGIKPERYSGHSFRSGYITAAAEAGVPLSDLREKTRHKRLESLLPYLKPNKKKRRNPL